MNYYDEIKEKLIKSEIYDRSKAYLTDGHKVSVYFEIGKLLCEASKGFDKNIIKKYFEILMIEVGEKHNERNLSYTRKFYEEITQYLMHDFEKYDKIYSNRSYVNYEKKDYIYWNNIACNF